jgi:hypothetical protein
VEFDKSIGLPPSWIDTKTLKYFNTIRDNIFSSSGIFEVLIPQKLEEKRKKEQ